MMLRINKVHWPVTVLGYGKRVGIWFQGCSIGCKGCVSLDTWDSTLGAEISPEELLVWCKSVTCNILEGITISGGEPFDQPQQLNTLLDALVEWRLNENLQFDILCYSGYTYRVLKQKYAHILSKIDVLIPEPFHQRKPAVSLRGSKNQTVLALTPLGKQRYTPELLDAKEAKRFQIQVDQQEVWFIGIPAKGDLEKLEKRCAEQGLKLANVSWRP